MNLGFKVAFFHDDVFVSRLQGRVLFLQLLVLPSSPSVLKPDGNLTRVKAKLGGEPVLLLRLELMLVTEI